MKKIVILVNIILIFSLLILLIEVPYKIYYNQGNELYENGDFEEAISKYEKALKFFPPKYKECSIRINLALSMLKNMEGSGEKEDKLKVLYAAKDVLCEDGCANRDNDEGHSTEAERLKKDIEKEIERLKTEVNDTRPVNSSQGEKPEEKEEDSKDIEKKLKELEEIQEEAMVSRHRDLSIMSGFSDYDLYFGKKW